MGTDVRTIDGVAVVTPQGLLLGGKETDEVQDRIKELIQAGNMKLLIDLGKTTYMNTMGLVVMFGARASYVKRGGCVKICSVDKKIRQLFVLVKLPLVYGDDLCETQQEALASFRETVTS